MCTQFRVLIGSDTMTGQSVRNWFVKFDSVDTSFEDEPNLGGSSSFDDDVSKMLMEGNP